MKYITKIAALITGAIAVNGDCDLKKKGESYYSSENIDSLSLVEKGSFEDVSFSIQSNTASSDSCPSAIN